MPYALKSTAASVKLGRDNWFRFMTAIGPCNTCEPSERALFHSEQDAMNITAYVHPLSTFEIEKLPEGALGDYDWNK